MTSAVVSFRALCKAEKMKKTGVVVETRPVPEVKVAVETRPVPEVKILVVENTPTPVPTPIAVPQPNYPSWVEWMDKKRRSILRNKKLRADNPIYIWARHPYPFYPEYDSEVKTGYTVLMLKDAIGRVIKSVDVDNREEYGDKDAVNFLRYIDRFEAKYHEAALTLIRQYAEESIS